MTGLEPLATYLPPAPIRYDREQRADIGVQLLFQPAARGNVPQSDPTKSTPSLGFLNPLTEMYTINGSRKTGLKSCLQIPSLLLLRVFYNSPYRARRWTNERAPAAGTRPDRRKQRMHEKYASKYVCVREDGAEELFISIA